MNAQKVSRIMPQIYSILRTHPVMVGFSRRQVCILTRIIFISLLHSTSGKSKAVYCMPSGMYLAKAVVCTRETVSRNLQILKDAKLLDIIHRRRERGRWSTNLYKLGSLLWALIQDVTTRFFSLFNRVISTSHIGTENHSKLTSRQQKGEVSPNIKSPPLDNYLLTLSKKMGFEG